MKFIHTSDWHLGKMLENKTRYDEQIDFIEEISALTERENVDMVLISGDIYDTSNPSALAEKIFFESVVRLAGNGKRPVIVIAGNHDSPDRLLSASEILLPYGVIISGRPFDFNKSIVMEKYSIKPNNGSVIVEKNGEKAVIVLLPYVSDKRVNEVIGISEDEEENAKSYSDKVEDILFEMSKEFSDKTINIVMAHLYTAGGTESGSERSIQLGGSYSVNAEAFPKMAQYIALGHLHRPQTVSGADKKAFYSGSPLPYSKEESSYSKAVNIVTVNAGERAVVEKYPLSCKKPIEIWRVNSIQEAIERCEENKDRNCYVYIEIKTDRVISVDEIRKMKLAKADIMDIKPIMEDTELSAIEERDSLSLEDSFIDYYKKMKSAEPDKEVLELFLSIFEEDGEPK